MNVVIGFLTAFWHILVLFGFSITAFVIWLLQKFSRPNMGYYLFREEGGRTYRFLLRSFEPTRIMDELKIDVFKDPSYELKSVEVHGGPWLNKDLAPIPDGVQIAFKQFPGEGVVPIIVSMAHPEHQPGIRISPDSTVKADLRKCEQWSPRKYPKRRGRILLGSLVGVVTYLSVRWTGIAMAKGAAPGREILEKLHCPDAVIAGLICGMAAVIFMLVVYTDGKETVIGYQGGPNDRGWPNQ
jgi:hypothetical protein